MSSERIRGKVQPRSVGYPLLRRRAGGENDAKSQISLEMGSEEYRKYVRDSAGVDERDFVDPALVTNPEQAKDKRLSDEDQQREFGQDMGEEAEHVADLAGDLAAAGEAQAEVGADVAELKHVRRMAKSAHVGDMKQALIDAAATTETTRDDAIAKSVSKRSIDDLPDIRDDDVTEEEYVPLARHRYF